MDWIYYKSFSKISAEHLYALLKLRQDVFIIEQDCIYNDLDGLDQDSSHLLGFVDEELAMYARIVPAGIKFDEVSIGRIVVNPKHRNLGLGKALVKKSLHLLKKSGERNVRIEAQAHLENFYQSMGFTKTSSEYEVDSIPHIQMLCMLT